ncbi:MAG: hypothetical protein WCQ99_14265 [Pseudomonadota bacterium]
MGIELLEEKFQKYIAACPHNIQKLQDLADRAALVQMEMRKLFNEITPFLCRDCAAACCQCMPVEGWFTESDYFLYRMRHAAPCDLRMAHDDYRSCAFLGLAGCVLPEDLRPFPCVKVNCRMVAEALEARGHMEVFTGLYNALGLLQEELWPLLADIHSSHALQAQAL